LAQTTAHADLVQAIHILVNELPIAIIFWEIKGHQDNHKDYDELDRPSQMNVEVDRAAKAYLCQLIRLPEVPEIPQEIHKEGWCCWINGEKITLEHSETV